MKKLIAVILILILSIQVGFASTVLASDDSEISLSTDQESTETTGSQVVNEVDNMGLTADSAVLMEGSTGELIYEKEKDKQVNPASITKIMTLILIFEALDSGRISLTDQVTVSEHAASMGGSQVYLEPNEVQTVEVMIKCISIASANDACVAMSELLGGSETEFVAQMNQKAKELGMKNTHFVNCCGLDVDNHYTTAYDVAIMSRELITKHPQISNYATVWMDEFTHKTKKGESTFGLTNTNKLVRTYNGITGLKTGSTSKAKFCLSASAHRNDMDLIAVVMTCDSPTDRFREAASLLDYGFANCSLFTDDNKDLNMAPVIVRGGIKDEVIPRIDDTFSYMCLKGNNPDDITKKVSMAEELVAPVNKGDTLGKVTYYLQDKEIGSVPIVASESIREATFLDSWIKILKQFFAAD